METLQITLFGNFTIVHPSIPAQLRPSPSAQGLLAYLLLQRRMVAREVLMEVFWGHIPPDRARSSLATALWRLRQVLEPAPVRPGAYLVTHSTGEVGFNWASDHWLDTVAFERSIQALLRKPLTALSEEEIRQIEGALACYRGDLLEGTYEDWALGERERFRSLHLNCLTRLMEYYAAHQEFERSIACGQEALRRDPLREEVHRALMRLYAESGQRALAMRQYLQCREHLSRELGMPPLEETQALYRQIAGAPQAGVRALALPSAVPELALLLYELQRVQQSMDEAARTLAQIQAAVSQFAQLL